MMWLIIVLVLGASIIIFEYFLESLVVFLERQGVIKTSSAAWFSNGTLQMQWMAHEELGLGNWDNCTGPRAIPVTRKGEFLGVLDYRDPNHPRLVDPKALSSTTDTNEDSALSDGEEKITANKTDGNEAQTSTSEGSQSDVTQGTQVNANEGGEMNANEECHASANENSAITMQHQVQNAALGSHAKSKDNTPCQSIASSPVGGKATPPPE